MRANYTNPLMTLGREESNFSPLFRPELSPTQARESASQKRVRHRANAR